MKSLIEEASTIGKAIETAWERAGQPQSFSVKIFENPEYGFFGMTKKYGKIAIFFDENANQGNSKKKNELLSADNKKTRSQKKFQNQEKDSVRPHEKTKNDHSNAPSRGEPLTTSERSNAKPKKEVVHASSNTAPERPKEAGAKTHSSHYVWTDPMIEHVNNIIKEVIHLLDHSDISFNIKNEQHNLKIIFNGLLVNEAHKEYSFYKHFAHLIITALRTKFKTEFKHLRLVLSRE